MFKLAIICGGPSLERGISLNSARSVMDHLSPCSIEIIPFYVDINKQFYSISCAQLYSNTPSDFDFKLKNATKPLSHSDLKAHLKRVDLVFPVIHGAFGEDGELQKILEEFDVPFVGPNSASCAAMFHKTRCQNILKDKGFPVFPQIHLFKARPSGLNEIKHFFSEHTLARAVVKPAMGGSSIGVKSVSNPDEALLASLEILDAKICDEVIIEPFCDGIEFTIVVFQNSEGQPVALMPTEIEMNYDKHQLFDFRRKYLPTNQTRYHTPARFSVEMIDDIRARVETIFHLFDMRDFVRIDGWIAGDNQMYFTDINPISGLEQNSFLFRQASLLSLSHTEILMLIIKSACRRYGLEAPTIERSLSETHFAEKKPVFVLFGSYNAERQVSLMSGTNVWLKLLHSKKYLATPYFLDAQDKVWQIPYSYALNHTVEEIHANCLDYQAMDDRWQKQIAAIQQLLEIKTINSPCPTNANKEDFLNKASDAGAFVFIALHGGEGENGTLQQALERRNIFFNGSSAKTSSLCMDKYLTALKINSAGDKQLESLPKIKWSLSQLTESSEDQINQFWLDACQKLSASLLVVKPVADGCSAGIVVLQSASDLQRYCQFISQKISPIPAFAFFNQRGPVETPTLLLDLYLLEPYIETDQLTCEEGKILHVQKEGWLEMTVGVLEKEGVYHALNPSITIAEGAILSLEEKFQGGTGINLTPPPENLVSKEQISTIKLRIERVAQLLEIQNYARIDVFFNRLTSKLIVIEANTLPGLTPSTVIYHQALAEEEPLTPLQLIEELIASKCV